MKEEEQTTPYGQLHDLEQEICKQYPASSTFLLYIDEIRKQLEMENLEEILSLTDELEELLDFSLMQRRNDK